MMTVFPRAVFRAGRSLPPTAPRGGDSHSTRRVFHGAFSGGEATRPTPLHRFHTLTT